jgi:hypothetical protein
VSAKRSSEKAAHQARDLVRLFIEREVTGIEYMNVRFGEIALIGRGLGNYEGRIVPSPND